MKSIGIKFKICGPKFIFSLIKDGKTGMLIRGRVCSENRTWIKHFCLLFNYMCFFFGLSTFCSTNCIGGGGGCEIHPHIKSIFHMASWTNLLTLSMHKNQKSSLLIYILHHHHHHNHHLQRLKSKTRFHLFFIQSVSFVCVCLCFFSCGFHLIFFAGVCVCMCLRVSRVP
jgi:hypothetical protein